REGRVAGARCRSHGADRGDGEHDAAREPSCEDAPRAGRGAVTRGERRHVGGHSGSGRGVGAPPGTLGHTLFLAFRSGITCVGSISIFTSFLPPSTYSRVYQVVLANHASTG